MQIQPNILNTARSQPRGQRHVPESTAPFLTALVSGFAACRCGEQKGDILEVCERLVPSGLGARRILKNAWVASTMSTLQVQLQDDPNNRSASKALAHKARTGELPQSHRAACYRVRILRKFYLWRDRQNYLRRVFVNENKASKRRRLARRMAALANSELAVVPFRRNSV